MIHVSELTQGYVKNPNEIVKEGDEVEAKILNVDRKKKQIKLSMKALQPEIEEFKPAKEEKKGHGKRHAKKEVMEAAEPEEPREPELTGMQIAWQEAMSRANKDKAFKVRRAKSGISDEREEILNRTLEKRLPTGG